MYRIAGVAAALALLVLLAACGPDEVDTIGAGASPTDRPPSLDARTFISRSVSGHQLVEGTEIRLTFKDGNLGAQAGCNSLGAPYSLDGDRIVTDGTGMSMTEIGCDPPRHDQDEWLSGFLTSKPTYKLAGDDLTLRSGDVTIELRDREVVEPDRPLVRTTWRVDTILSGDSASSVPEGGHVTLEFPSETTFRATAKDCNTAEGTMTVARGTITFDEFTVTAIGCPSPWAETLKVLQAGETRYSIEADRLTIQADEDGIAAVAQDT
jgi:heat shock protein HslJ